LLALTFLTAGGAQTLDKVKLDHFLDRTGEKNKVMGSLFLARGVQCSLQPLLSASGRSFGMRRTSDYKDEI
jgi:hypothetical protein